MTWKKIRFWKGDDRSPEMQGYMAIGLNVDYEQ